jgi:subtilase family serine protease
MISSSNSRLVLTALALGTALALTCSAGIPARAAGASRAVPIARITALRQGDVVIGALPNTQPMHILVALKVRNRDQLDSLIAAQRTLTPAQFSVQHAPTHVQAQTVANYLTIMGFKNVVISANRLLVSADGTADNAQAAFLTSFARVKTKEGRMAFANSREAYIPAALQNSVLSVLGLEDVHQVHSLVQRLQPGVETAPASISGHVPTDFSSIYGGTGVPTAAGVTVGIITVGDLTQTIADLNTFTANNSLPTVITQTVDTGGTSGDTDGTLEWNLDSQSLVGAAGGRVGKLIFYNEPDWLFTSLVANFNAAVTANVAKIINVSLGACELAALNSGAAAATDQILQVATAQGQTFSISTGDSGANECGLIPSRTPSWPASSPYVVAVAGTVLYASTTTWSREVVWNRTGGSPSTFEPKPIWQNALVPGSKRGVADVAFVGSPLTGAKVVYQGGIAQVGGTSLSAPIFAGLWARVIAVKGSAVGFAAPLLYQLPASDFHDVIYGNNNGYSAGPGYDFPSGRGSLILNTAIKHIAGSTANIAPIANFSYTAFGLVARFTDSSTDSDGSIATRAWTFGDGGRSTAANPSHTYAKAGTYSVAETVTDNGGRTNTKTRSLTIGQ